MDLMNLKSVEELLYELVFWLLFYPLTLWKCVRRPIRTMALPKPNSAPTPKSDIPPIVSDRRQHVVSP